MSDELMDEVDFHVSVADGKYTFVSYKNGKAEALRYGDTWRDCLGDGFILGLAQEILSLRARLEESEKKLEAAEATRVAADKSIKSHWEAYKEESGEHDKTKQRATQAEADVGALLDALRWCSGSPDFNEGGQARKGWIKLCNPLLATPHPHADLLAENERLREVEQTGQVLINQFYKLKRPLGANVMNPFLEALKAYRAALPGREG